MATDQRKPRTRQPNARQKSDASLAERDEMIWQLRLQGYSLRQIGAQVGLSHPSVLAILERGYAERIYPRVDEQRAVEFEHLDALRERAWRVMERDHVHVSHGRIVRDDEGNPILDDGPVLAAIDRLTRIAERRARLGGLDAPTKVQAEVENVTPPPEVLARIAEARARVEQRELEIKASGGTPAGDEE